MSKDQLLRAGGFAAAAVAGFALAGCSRPSSTASSGASVAPVVSAAPAPSAAPVESTAPAGSAAPPAVTAAPAPASPAASSNPKGEDCSRIAQAPEYRDLPEDDRARARLTCEVKEEFRAFVAARQSCSAASECTIVSGACPFGCYVPVRKAAEKEVTAKLEQLGGRLDQAGHRCVYRCMGQPSAACVDQRCATGPR